MQLQSRKNTIFEGGALHAYSNYLPLLAYRSCVTSKSNKRRKTGCSKQVSHQLSVMPHNKIVNTLQKHKSNGPGPSAYDNNTRGAEH